MKYFDSIRNRMESLNTTIGDYVITHEPVPVTLKDVSADTEDTIKWDLVDDITITNVITKEQFNVRQTLLHIPHRAFDGYKLKGSKKQITNLYEKAKGWHFCKDKEGRKIATFSSDFSKSAKRLSCNIVVNKYINELELDFGKGKRVNLAVFLKALTGESFLDIMSRIEITSAEIINTFSVDEPSVIECVELCIEKFMPNTTYEQFSKNQKAPWIVDKFRSHFIGRSIYIGEDTQRIINQLSFRKLKDYCLAESVAVPHTGVVIPANTLLTVDLLNAFDASEVDKIVCKDANGVMSFVFKKYESYTYRIPKSYKHPQAGEDRQRIEIRDLMDLNKTTGVSTVFKDVEFTRAELPIYNSVELFFSAINTYLNYLNDFPIDDSDYSLNHQSVVTIERDILSFVTEYVNLLNNALENFTESDDVKIKGLTLLETFPSYIPLIKKTALVDKYVDMDGKATPLPTSDNMLAIIAQESLVVKDIKDSPEDMDYLQSTQIGRFDPFEVPENSNIGTTHNKTFLSQVSQDSQIRAPFARIINGDLERDATGEVVIHYLSVDDEQDQYIGEWDEEFGSGVDMSQMVSARFNNEMLKIPKNKLTYIEASCYQHMSASRSLSPFPESMSGKRALMASSQGRQSIPILGAERPLVNSGTESIIAHMPDSTKAYYTADDLIIELTDGVISTGSATIEFLRYGKMDNDRSYVFQIKGEGTEPLVVEKTLPYARVSTQKALYGFNLNTKLGKIFKGNDVVLYSISYDPTVYSADKRNDFYKPGSVGFEKDVFDTGMALGLNLHVGYMTYGSSSIDDAIVINDRLVTEDNLSSIIIHKETYELDIRENKEEYFGFLNNIGVSGFDKDGLPLIGTYLAPNSTIIYKHVKKLDPSSEETTVYQSNIKLSNTARGEVINVIRDEAPNGKLRGVTIYIAALEKVEVGDKMAGRYGNKGVIGKIVPNHEMPFDPETGKPLDIILNPLGIPSRLNPSQILEVALAACNIVKDTISVVTPFHGDMINQIKSQSEELGVKPRRLLNPLTGTLTHYEINVGEIYMYRLYHRAATKIRSLSRTSNLDATFKQPVGSAGPHSEKGQAVGEMESWCYLSYGAKHLLQEVQTALSTDLDAFEAARSGVLESPKDFNFNRPERLANDNDEHLMVLLQSLGITIKQDPVDKSLVHYVPMTDIDIEGVNPGNPVNIDSPKTSLRDEAIFGDVRKGTVKWSWIPLHAEIINPFWIEKSKICKSIVVYKEAVTGYEQLHMGKKLAGDILEQKLYMYTRDGMWFCSQNPCLNGFENDIGYTGMTGLVRLFKEYDFTIAKSYYIQKAKKDSSALEVLNYIEHVETTGLGKYVITKFPVMPLRYRPEPAVKGKAAEFDFFYNNLAGKIVGNQDSVDNNHLYILYQTICELLGFTEKTQNIKDGHPDIVTFFTNKNKKGKIRDKMAKKRIHRSGRASLVPMADTAIPPTHIGIPFLIAADIFSLEFTHVLSHMFKEQFTAVSSADKVGKSDNTAKERLASRIIRKAILNDEKGLLELIGPLENLNHLKNLPITQGRIVEPGKPLWRNACTCIKEHMSHAMKDTVVIFGRQPSLHKHSVRGFKVVLVNDKSLHVHPLVCAGFNADFDGDTGYVFAPLSADAKREALELMSVEASIINAGNGQNILSPSQDILLGNYYVTTFKDNHLVPDKDLEVLSYRNVKHIVADLEAGVIEPYRWVTVMEDGKLYVSTAGRVVFNSLIPAGFTDNRYTDKYDLGIGNSFNDLRFDYIVSGRVSDDRYYTSLPAIFDSILDDFLDDKQKVIEYYQTLSEFGFKWSERSGISFNLRDIEDSKLVSEFIRKSIPVSNMIDKHYSLGLITAEDKQNAYASLYAELRSKDFRKAFMANFDRTNNVFMMFDSKAKGSEDQILQTCGSIGILQKTKTQSLEVPITNNYATGLSSFDCFQTAYSTRLGMISTIRGTSEPGELTRTLVYEFNGITVTADDCSTDNADTLVKVPYTLRSNDIFVDGNNVVRVGDKVVPWDASLLTSFTVVDDRIEPFFRKYDCSAGRKICAGLLQDLKAAGIPWFKTDKGIISFDMEVDPYFRRLLLYRYTSDIQLPGLVKGNYISNVTIKHIVETKPHVLDVSLLSNCFCKEGICANSYGLYYDSGEEVKVGDTPGYEAAQAIGEPSAQLVISLVNKGGKAGESIEGGIAVIKSAMQNANIKVAEPCYCAPFDGYIKLGVKNTKRGLVKIISIENDTHAAIFELIGKEPIVLQGSYVTLGTKLTEGDVHPIKSFVARTIKDKVARVVTKSNTMAKRERLVNPSMELIFRVRYELAKFYGVVYENNSINILGRHLEYTAFAQTTHGYCISSTNDEYKVGKLYPLGQLIRQDGVGFEIRLQNAKAIISNNSGKLTASCYQDICATLSGLNLETQGHKEQGFLGKLLTGSDLTGRAEGLKKIKTSILPISVQKTVVNTPISVCSVETQSLDDLLGDVLDTSVMDTFVEEPSVADEQIFINELTVSNEPKFVEEPIIIEESTTSGMDMFTTFSNDTHEDLIITEDDYSNYDYDDYDDCDLDDEEGNDAEYESYNEYDGYEDTVEYSHKFKSKDDKFKKSNTSNMDFF